ncbi:Pimeloyl-ACP methyl ester carboxylesterase [Friedmanniella luteola]|uniref:Pimeloyl-ACP methyl ester carboxylesterase n=1 Tax=Friedmanniella luteola TaxID=546871 RepID=A0A1H1RTR8_9ACTN|nr:alpha/beta fold hydrolase [Friedmanniella luteola]SDS38936.1 Pimeloyl-ACP methyl ester carboxylesterase [Friedmanniella luteola]
MTQPTVSHPHPVLFIHGLWIHSAAWQPWQDLFEAAGHPTSAPGWPGDGPSVQATRDDPSALDGIGILDICRHYADLVDAMPVRPVVVGHSFGGLIAQELLANGYAAAAVAIDPAPIKGVKVLPFAQLRSGLPVLGNPANRKRTVSLTAEQFRYSFGNALSEAESDALHQQWTIPGPGRPLFEDAGANFSRNSPAAVDSHHAVRGPLLLISGTEDHTVPRSVTEAVLKLYADNPSVTDYQVIEGRGHSLTIDSGWRDVATVTLDWIDRQEAGLLTTAPSAGA